MLAVFLRRLGKELWIHSFGFLEPEAPRPDSKTQKRRHRRRDDPISCCHEVSPQERFTPQPSICVNESRRTTDGGTAKNLPPKRPKPLPMLPLKLKEIERRQPARRFGSWNSIIEIIMSS
jgi:hypothetical protein